VALMAGLRAATATVAPILLAAALGEPELLWAALGGWLTSLADAGGAYRTRTRSMAAFVVGGAITCAVASLASEHRIAALVLAGAWAGMGGLLRLGGDAGAALGTMFAATFVAALSQPTGDPRQALLRGALLGAGGLSAMALGLLVWPVRPYAPVREMGAAAVHALAALARGLRDAFHAAVRAPDGGEALDGPRSPFATLARTRHAPVRAALEGARVALAQTRRTRLATSRGAEDLAVLLEQVDELFAAIVATEGALEAAGHASHTDERVREAIAAVLRRLPEALDGLAASVALGRRAGQRPAALPALDRAVVALWDAIEPLPDGDAPAVPIGERVGHAAALLEQVATLIDATADTTAAMVAGRDAVAAPRPVRTTSLLTAPRRALAAVAGALRTLAHPDVVTRRHAVRMAFVVTASQLLGGALHVNRAQWMTTTALLVLQPYAGATWQRGAARLGGTILGGVVAAVLAALVHDQLALAATMFVLAVAAVAVRRIDYALFTFFLTPLFVLLAEPALGDWRLAGVRIVDTLTGGAIAVLTSRLLWPTFESQGIPTTLGTLLDRVRESLDAAARAAGLRPDEQGGLTPARARRRMGLAANMADAALERWLAEPRVRRHDAEALLTVLAEVRRVGVACTGLASLPRHAGPPPAPLVERVAALDAMLADLADAVRTGRAPAPADQGVVAGAAGATRRTAEHLVASAAAGPLARVARHVLGLHGAVTRLVGSAPDARDAA
jgi:uncharacterized membrane protein YccC